MSKQRRLYFCQVCMHRQKATTVRDPCFTYCETCQAKRWFTLCPWSERQIDAQRFAVREAPARERDRGLRPVR